MHVIVCVKQVPSVEEVKVDAETGRILREELPLMVNPNDRNAIEAALRLRDEVGGTVTAVSMGPPQAEEALREAMAMGVNRAVLISDPALAGSDAFVTSKVLAKAALKLAPFDLIVCGSRSADGETGIVGVQIAEELNLPQITWVLELKVEGEVVRAKRSIDGGYEIVEACLPAVVTVTRDANKPRYPTMRSIVEACRRPIERLSLKDLGLSPEEVGFKGSPTRIERVFQAERKRRATIISKPVEEAAREVALMILRELGKV
ncbi:MAG: electron transfer flavoprotein subunit beta/FixA family protein [Candidatus Jordarchaeales archaeon]